MALVASCISTHVVSVALSWSSRRFRKADAARTRLVTGLRRFWLPYCGQFQKQIEGPHGILECQRAKMRKLKCDLCDDIP